MKPSLVLCVYVAVSGFTCVGNAPNALAETSAPRIVNIVNFIRLLEPRNAAITEDVLYRTVENQVELMQEHDLPGTFLLQYDALMDPRYQKLLKSLPAEQFEIGAWWELPQPLVEKSGLKWRGRFPWDWHANVGFVSGYTPAEREKLADVYMADFKGIFGHYPKSVASWFIDAHTLQYLHDKYGIVASANCKDQVGTDGYTLWGGYWNQAYYPSKLNAYMPAQTEAGQIPVPVFRMLGSDPLRQYDAGIGGAYQGVISLEPVYGNGGASREWVDWFIGNMVDGECLAFNYTQAGQENSFTWRSMRQGLQYQFPLIAKLRDEGKLRVETLAASGEWFREKFPVTPPTAMTYLTPPGDDPRQTVWFNSRFYRTNLIWEQGKLRVRDIHLFDESMESPILQTNVDRSSVEFYTLPVVDGFHWSSPDKHAGLRFKARVDGEVIEIEGDSPEVTKQGKGELLVTWPLKNVPGKLILTLDEQAFTIELEGTDAEWWAELDTADSAKLPFTKITSQSIAGKFQAHPYEVEIAKGTAEPLDRGYKLLPGNNRIELNFAKPSGD